MSAADETTLAGVTRTPKPGPNIPSLLFPGVRHYETTGVAMTWIAYDALAEEDGWEAHSVVARGRRSEWKVKLLDGNKVTVFPPVEPRGGGR